MYDLSEYDDGYSDGYNAGLDDAHARVPLIVSLVLFFFSVGVGVAIGYSVWG